MFRTSIPTGLYHGLIFDLDDPEGRGRMRVRVDGFNSAEEGDISPWCYVCVPFAGDGYGLFMLPQVGDEVIAAPLVSGDWVVLGAHWSGRKAKPAVASLTNRVLRTPAGHQLQLDDEGDITVEARDSGASLVLKANGDIELNGAEGKVVTTKHICAYTGKGHPQGSGSVKAKK